jgi:hypothetical protein
MKVAQEIQDGLIRVSAAIRKYGFCQRTIYNWINKYSLRKLAQEDCTSFNKIKSVLNGQCITDMDEDENGNGNLYLATRQGLVKVERK